MFPRREEGNAPAAIAGNIAHILLDVDAHKLPHSMGAAQLAEGMSKADRLAVHPQDGAIQHHQCCAPANQHLPESQGPCKTLVIVCMHHA